MTIWRNIAAFAAVAAFGTGQAQAQALAFPGCVQRGEAETLVALVLPALIDGVGTKCGPALGGNAILARPSPGARYRADADAAWPKARGTIERIGGSLLSGFLSEDVQRTVVEQALSAAIVEKVATKDCAAIDQALTALAPLPGRNLAQAVVIGYDLFSRSRDNLPIRLCPENGE